MISRLNENTLTLWDSTVDGWFAGLVFALLGGGFIYGTLATSDFERSEMLGIVGFTLFGALFIGVGIHILIYTATTRIVFDRRENKVFVTHFGLLGIRRAAYSFDEIKQMCLLETESVDDTQLYALGIRLTNGKTVLATATSRVFEKYDYKCIVLTNEFMRKPAAILEPAADAKSKN